MLAEIKPNYELVDKSKYSIPFKMLICTWNVTIRFKVSVKSTMK